MEELSVHRLTAGVHIGAACDTTGALCQATGNQGGFPPEPVLQASLNGPAEGSRAGVRAEGRVQDKADPGHGWARLVA